MTLDSTTGGEISTKGAADNFQDTARKTAKRFREQAAEREIAKQSKQGGRVKKTIYTPIEGHAWNPLLELPRNMVCPCESGKKFKHCHLRTLPVVVTEGTAGDYKRAMEAGIEGIRFTKEDPLAKLVEG